MCTSQKKLNAVVSNARQSHRVAQRAASAAFKTDTTASKICRLYFKAFAEFFLRCTGSSFIWRHDCMRRMQNGKTMRKIDISL